MNENDKEKMVSQALAMANNYFCTGRTNKAIEVLGVVQKIDPTNELLSLMKQKLFFLSSGVTPPDLNLFFGKLWDGEPLQGKSIEIFCDQGIGDTINLLRYVRVIKQKYNCKIVLNCYAFFDEFQRLIATQDYIDEFTKFHVNCDYSTNIMSIPALVNSLSFDVYYPVHFQEIMNKEIPEQPVLGDFSGLSLEGKNKVGIVWKSNVDNPLSLTKSIDPESFRLLETLELSLYCLQPDVDAPDYIQKLLIGDLYDTAGFIQQCDCVVSVDTAVLHLAGALGKKTFGLIPYDADPRWGKDSKTCWYPSVELFRQSSDGDWSQAICQIKERLVSFLKIV